METHSVTKESDASHNTLILKAREHMYNSRELCLYDLNKIKEVLKQFVHNDDVDGKLKTESLSLLNCLTRFIDK
jgi:hypothetical protein